MSNAYTEKLYVPIVEGIVDVHGRPLFWPSQDKERLSRIMVKLLAAVLSLTPSDVFCGRKKTIEGTREYIQRYIVGSREGNHYLQIVCDEADNVVGCIGYWMGSSTLYDQDEAVQHDFSIVAPGLAAEQRAMVVDRMEKMYQDVLADWLP